MMIAKEKEKIFMNLENILLENLRLEKEKREHYIQKKEISNI